MFTAITKRLADGKREVDMWLERWRARRRLGRVFSQLDGQELDRALADVGMSRADMSTLFRKSGGHRRLMGRMMAHYGVDHDTAAPKYWAALRDAERVCAECRTRGRCKRWFAWGRANDAPRIFCPNADLFDEVARD